MLILVIAGLLAGAPMDSTPSARLAALADLVWQHQTERDGAARLRAGLPVVHLPDLSEAGSRADAVFWRKVGATLVRMPVRGLSPDEAVTRDMLAWQAARAAEEDRFYWYPSMVSPYASSLGPVSSVFGSLPVATAEDRARYLDLVKEYGAIFGALRAKLVGQVKRHLVLTRPDLDLAIPLWKSRQVAARSMPVWVGAARLAGLAEADRADFGRKLEALLDGPVRRGLDSLVEFMAGPYYAAAPAKVGQGQYPFGKDYYRYLVRLHTTLSITPEEVFRIGEQQIDSLFKELDRVRQEVGFTGTVQEFKESLRKEPRYFVGTPEAVGARLDGYAATMETKIDSLFGSRPKAPYGTQRLDPALEPTMTYGYYDPPTPQRPKGLYFFNGSKLEDRNLAMAEGLSYHELIPGHHFQIASVRENDALSRYRREQGFTAYIEGWGDYASMLGTDAGLYRDPYSRAGRLTMEMMTGTRLVLDVGMNYYGWSLDKARAYMKEHTLETERQIATETLRYSADIPGQALAYRMGSLAFRRIREKAKKALGEKWDVRKFHHLVLLSGAMPLDVLERRVDRFVTAELAGQ